MTTEYARQSRGNPVDAMRGSRHDLFENPEAKLRYQVYSRLQSTSVAIGESFPIPEIVAIGGQSDGKSSLLEAFLGFRFNVREVEMGTRRPLIVQMYHDPTAQEPRCRLQDEDGEDYGLPIQPETAVADAITRRTEEHLRKLGGATVSSKPIVMKVEYAYCPNLTIIDTPGFILKAKSGEADRTPEDILAMVKAQAQPAHRLILFLQQSSVEWASSLWLNVVQEVDPHFQRTVFVASKFDNRMKEFAERWEVDKYLAATGYLPQTVKPFFVALPKDRAAQSSSEWRRQMQEVDTAVIKQLRDGIKGGFDEERFGTRIGFSNLKKFLEEELARRYREAAPHVLSVLQDRVDAASRELLKSDSDLKAAEDVSAVRATAMRFTSNVAGGVQRMLGGCTDVDPQQHGLTTEEERTMSRLIQWPGLLAKVVPPNAGLKLFGGAAFERCLNEFQEAAHALKFPATLATDRVANLLLAYKGRSSAFAPGRAAEDIARQMARDSLGPLLDTACARLAYVLKRVLEASADRALASGSTKDTLRPYVSFHAALRTAHLSFLSRLDDQTRQQLRQHLEASTSEFAMNLMASLPDMVYEEEECSEDVEDRGAGVGDRIASDGTLLVQDIHRTIPETPSASPLPAPQPLIGGGGDFGVTGRRGGVGPGRMIDNSPSKRAPKSLRITSDGVRAGNRIVSHTNSIHHQCDSYEDVIRRAESLFNKIRYSVAQQTAPTTLKSAFLDPIKERMSMEVLVEMFARSDADFMAMFTAPGALAQLASRRDSIQKRVDSLLKLKNEFQELSRVL
ncbi:hypothetical protein CEUSTIGMA_g1464.t1 [Chlamydomonas eustigma]|uniref:Dynamin-type G domain-containing protein n=1 Tax=Chlamydomonas eustigma TaxID=1157962 RepID=A0A250WT56_9CHLO|nr:hypothetical protein CEUSTIGMA_g1464.t1 [Chlamydomonas eustigma]|eukprot:GAX74014.1 hypothetical protein CEUSTIGMA_g1464.t1 [Chlamydomonas eustigma]